MLVENSATEESSEASSLNQSRDAENEALIARSREARNRAIRARQAEEREDFAWESMTSRRRAVWILVLGLIFGPYLFTRATAPFSRITSHRVSDVAASLPLDTAKRPLKVAVYNVAHGRGVAPSNWYEGGEPKTARSIRIGQFLKTLDADVVVLNEVDFKASWSGGVNQAELIAEQAGFPYFVCQSNMDFGHMVGRLKFGNAVLSKFPIQNTKYINLPAHRMWENWLLGCKKGVLCTIELNYKTSVDVAAVHLEHRNEGSRNDAATFLANFLEYESMNPLIVAGDLNTTPVYAPKANQTKDGLNAFDEFVKATSLSHLPKKVTGENLTFPSWKPATAIDWVLFDDVHFEALSHKVINSDLSDHLPVVVELQLRD